MDSSVDEKSTKGSFMKNGKITGAAAAGSATGNGAGAMGGLNFHTHSHSSSNSNPKRIDPLSVTASYGIKTFRRETRRPWTKEEDEQLTNVVMKNYDYSDGTTNINISAINWELVAKSFEKTTQRKLKDCRKRWSNSLDPTLKKGKWTEEEDSLLLSAYEKYGPSWKKVAIEISGRTDDQCAKRYVEVLDPDTKDRLKPWTHEEDMQLIRTVKRYGTKWKKVAQLIKGRPSLTCRNRWRKIMTDVARKKADPVIQLEVELMGKDDLKHEDLDDELDRLKKPKATKSILQPEDPNTPPELSTAHSHSHVHSHAHPHPHLHPNPHPHPTHLHSHEHANQHQLSQSDKLVQSSQRPQLYQRSTYDAPKLRKTVQSEVEWKYSLAPENNSRNILHEGIISDELLVQYLISYAKNNGIEVTVHQHIHHHYAPPPPPPANIQGFEKQQQQLQPAHQPQQSHQPIASQLHLLHHLQHSYQPEDTQSQSQGVFTSLQSPFGPLPSINEQTSGFQVEPETQVNRYQHFNYLPPLTEVPKLNSSASSPTSSSKEGNIQSHQGQQNQSHSQYYQQPKPQPMITATKDSDLLRLLSGRSPILRVPSPLTSSVHQKQLQEQAQNLAILQPRRAQSPLTPLAQAVELAAEEEEINNNLLNNNSTNNNIAKGNDEQNNVSGSKKRGNSIKDKDSPKRTKFEDEDEEGLDFWETMRNLTKPYLKQATPTVQETNIASSNSNFLNNKPVSQHHPLHHRSGNTPMPFEIDGEVEEDLDAYALFFNYPREASNIRRAQGNVTNGGRDNGSNNNVTNNTNNNNNNNNNSNNNNDNNSNNNNNYQSAYDAIASTFGMIPFNPS